MSADPNRPADPPIHLPKPRRSYFSKTAKAQSRQEKTARTTADALAAIPIVVGEILEAGNDLTPQEKSSAHLSTNLPSPAITPSIIKKARLLMMENAEFYVRAHVEAVKSALAKGKSNPKFLEVARRASEFAITSIGEGGDRIIDRKELSPALNQPTIQIGIALGGLPDHKRLTDGTNA